MFEKTVQDEAALRAALADADIAPMLMVLAHLSGDMAILDEVAPHIHGAWSFMEAVPEDLKQKVRDRLVATLKDYAATGREPPRDIPPDAMQRMMSAGVGQTVPADYIPLLIEETQLSSEDTRAVHWRRNDVAVGDFNTVIIGAGFSGLCAGIRLKQLGIPFTILEKNPDVGGTWLENKYPGCAVDTPNHFYSFSFNQNPDWTRHFSQRDEILAYIESSTDKFGIREHIRCGVEVREAHFNEATGKWSVTIRAADGHSETITANALITAVGQLNRPAMPDIPGLDKFKGPLFHTAEWDSSVDLRGRRVAMIGTGASAMQTGPSIAPDVARLLVFQRSRHWAANNPNYHKEVSAGNLWCIRNIPFFAQWMRFQLFWGGSDGFHPSLQIDPNWSQPNLSLNEANHKMREMLIDHMRKELDGDEELLAKVTPPYPPYGKRMLRDNHWFRMLKQPHVDLITDTIDRIEPDSIVMKDGTVHKVDVIIMATGFHASKMLAPMDITGRAGHSIRGDWGDDDPRAHLGITVPGFPNMFLLYGPNTNLAHGGSIIFHTECQVRYIAQVLRDMVENGTTTMEVRQDVFDAYNKKLDEAGRMMVWTHPGVTNWYKNKHNRLTVLSPWTLLDYWKLTRNYQPAEFMLRRGTQTQGIAAE